MEQVVTVHGPTDASHRNIARLRVGAAVLFGTCHCSKCGFDIALSLAAPIAGRITAYADHWRIDNLSRSEFLSIEDLELPQRYLMAMPGRVNMVIPFELAQVRSAATQALLFSVFGPGPQYTAESHECLTQPDSQAGEIATDTTYFAVLKALCAPRLNGKSTDLLPTSREICRDLKAIGLTLSPRAVDGHIDYLLKKLGIATEGQARKPGRAWKKDALVAAALTRGVVRPEHHGDKAA